MGVLGPRRDVLREEVVSNFKIVSIEWMNAFWTPASSENSHSFIVQEVLILPTRTEMGLEPSLRYVAFPGSESSSGNSFAETQVASEVSRPGVPEWS